MIPAAAQAAAPAARVTVQHVSGSSATAQFAIVRGADGRVDVAATLEPVLQLGEREQAAATSDEREAVAAAYLQTVSDLRTRLRAIRPEATHSAAAGVYTCFDNYDITWRPHSFLGVGYFDSLNANYKWECFGDSATLAAIEACAEVNHVIGEAFPNPGVGAGTFYRPDGAYGSFCYASQAVGQSGAIPAFGASISFIFGTNVFNLSPVRVYSI